MRRILYTIILTLLASASLSAAEQFKQDQYEKGVKLYYAGNLEEARTHLLESFARCGAHPDNFEGKLRAHMFLAMIDRDQHDYVGARKWLRSIAILERRFGDMEMVRWWADELKPIYQSITAMERLDAEKEAAHALLKKKINIMLCIVLAVLTIALFTTSFLLWKLGKSYKMLASKSQQIASISHIELKQPEDELCIKIRDYLTTTKCYLNEDFSLECLSERIGVNRTYTSAAVGKLAPNFRALVNQYRINEAVKLLSENKTKTFEAISEECGFSSVRTFYNAFKSVTGLTPSEFRRQL